MDIAGAMVHIKKLSGLGNGTKQRVIAPGSFSGFVETNGGTLGMTFCRQHGPIEIHSQARELFPHQAFNYKGSGQVLNVINAGIIHLGKIP